MKRCISAVLCLVLLCAGLTGCEPQPNLTGVWTGTIDMTQALNEDLRAADQKIAEYIAFSDITIGITLTCTEEKTYTISVDFASRQAASQNMLAQMSEGMTNMIADMLQARQVEMSVADFLTMSGLSLDTMLQETLARMELNEAVAELERQGKYQVSEELLYITDELDSEFTEDGYGYTLEENVLTIMAREADQNEKFADVMFPLVLTKAAQADQ